MPKDKLEGLAERWPGYDEQSWQERFAELDRAYHRQIKTFAEGVANLEMHTVELEAENARLREDVIEECAKVCQQVANETASMFPNHNLIAKRIRALAARQSLGEPKP